MRTDQILKALVESKPGSPKSAELRAAANHAVMKTLESGGLPAVERLVKTLNARGHRLEPTDTGAGRRWWREEHDGNVFELRVWSSRASKMGSLHYYRLRKPKTLTRAQLVLQAEQQRFYDRYREVGQKAYRDPRYRLSAVDRRLLLVGELEADVNNGGFSQYLHNKGRRRAGSAVIALVAIGARKTAAMLEQALRPGVSEARLAELDDRFYRVPEDLAVLAARYARL
ncbi:MAG TPA: DUF4375 domain-containing protein [Burkholderiales bacterium]|nr:DUF4375 domain-containing protein [Burkholderiales bacterium]